MALMHRTWQAYAMAGMMALYATAASSQVSSEPKAHDHAAPLSQGAAVDAKDARHDSMARMALLDQRIEMLTADMNMFVGDAKVRIMAELLTALVERESLSRHDMQKMRGKTMDSMMKGHGSPAREAPEAHGDEEPGAMCGPSPAP
jgi:hypothetical protein